MTLRQASALLLGAAAACAAAHADEAYLGKRFRVTGQWDGTRLHAERVDLREPGDDPNRGQVTGRVERIDLQGRSLRIGPFDIAWRDSTRFDGVSPETLEPGTPLRANVEMLEDVPFLASSIEGRPAGGEEGALQVIGQATRAEPLGTGGVELTILGVPVTLAQHGYNRAKSLTRRQDSRRPEQPLQTTFLGRPLTAGGEYSAKLLRRKNFKLDDVDDRVRLDQELKLELYYPASPSIALFAESKVLHEAELRDTVGTHEREGSLERGQLWLYVGGSRLGLQIGRQNFAEVREWWWDDDLDAVRLYYDQGPWHLQIGAARELASKSTLERDIDVQHDGVVRLFGVASWLWAPRQRIELFALHHKDRSRTQAVGEIVRAEREDASDANLTWLGLRAIGQPSLGKLGRILYWVDAAAVRGDEAVLDFADVSVAGPGTWEEHLSQVSSRAQRKVRGYAFDVGASWATRWALRPTFTLSYAFGSGDGDPQDDVDRSFRQTGLQENKWRFSGVNRFRYYGELLNPELANLKIATAAVGIPLLGNSSLEFVYHRFRQAKAADFMRDVRIDDGLTGASSDLGREIDLILGFRERRRWELELILGSFEAGEAYGTAAGRRAYAASVELTVNF